jgi:hypothetical protein
MPSQIARRLQLSLRFVQNKVRKSVTAAWKWLASRSKKVKVLVMAVVVAAPLAFGHLSNAVAFVNNALGAYKTSCEVTVEKPMWCVPGGTSSATPPAPTPPLPTTTPTPPTTASKSPADLAAYWDGTNPTACALLRSHTIQQFPVNWQGTDRLLATVEVKYSTACTTSWVRVVNTHEGTLVNKIIKREATAELPEKINEDSDLSKDFRVAGNEISYGMQLFAPGCVLVSVQISEASSGGMLGELPVKSVCLTQPPN